ncbi:hypothetical protein ENUP19_0263G0005 [Entamoeba nuttalli]|uniref:Leucine rich repeat protein, BspA family protein n=2 Tax=Entamoeba nuttalli TaxID=412467 RepID=K2HYQ2_ENTNP|nr:leucine rich repeat protein, BspA family protein [Entamoeba nuttalli P19]EKE41545.1 leucine rich repeat protein, BspA family protein [Entamoeba nuttalli P19]|eukprot:XP_008856122.1 leucine rich repeat protein, BspA family protein [Entamoeba nuttalli P19]
MSSFSHLTCQEALSILQYFTSRIDYIHFIQTTKKFRFVLEMFNSNPISLFAAKGLFPNISTQNLFTKKDRKIPGMKKYILWYDVNYTRCLKELEHKNTICKHVFYTKEERIKYGNNIPSGVNKIGSRCYELCGDLNELSLPTTITSLSEGCFMSCLKLSSIILPTTLCSLPHLCFYDCPVLQHVLLPTTLTLIDDNCFQKCPSLISIQLPSHLICLGDSCFYDCYNLTSIVLPSSLTSMGDFCFSRCDNLTTVRLPSKFLFPKYTFYESPNVMATF